jgi:hypothetical protein
VCESVAVVCESVRVLERVLERVLCESVRASVFENSVRESFLRVSREGAFESEHV